MGILVNIINAIFGTGRKSREDVERELTAIGNQRGLDPLHSIVDLLKALDLDSSKTARGALWGEIGGEGTFTGTAEQNQKLHAHVMDEIAKGYIGVPGTK